ncbi:MAG: DUF3899 domain-containing protein [Spirochaetaceae bacterium]|nr:DUF3899 domain-containing protein [Spirochaetaceae bacterium]
MTTRTSHRLRWVSAWASLCVLGYLAAGKDSVERAISDTCFLIGIACLISGLWRLVRKTGFFFITLNSIKRFFAVLANRGWSRAPLGESYQEYLRSLEADRTHEARLLVAAAILTISAVSALL